MTPIEPTWIDAVIVAVLAVLLPSLTAFVTLPKIRRLPPHVLNELRPQIYSQAMATQWLFAAAALHVVLLRGYGWDSIGLRIVPDRSLLIGFVLLAALAAFLLWQRRKIKQEDEGRELVRLSLRRVAWLLPRTPSERRRWWLVSAHAGWGEELFFRGYLFALFAHAMPLWAAAIASTLMFGLAHVYQGVRGIVLSALLGGVFIGLYVASGSLLVPMLAHALYDIHAGELGRWAYGTSQPEKSPVTEPNNQ
jgi:uncharacterized protein